MAPDPNRIARKMSREDIIAESRKGVEAERAKDVPVMPDLTKMRTNDPDFMKKVNASKKGSGTAGNTAPRVTIKGGENSDLAKKLRELEGIPGVTFVDSDENESESDQEDAEAEIFISEDSAEKKPTTKRAHIVEPARHEPRPFAHMRYVKERILNRNYRRLDMPSNDIFYDIDGIQMRTFEIKDLIKLDAAQRDRDFTGILDVMDSCVNMDIRDLAVPDFFFLMYMQRLMSYQRSPWTFNWTSKYGNENTHEIKETNLVVKNVAMTREEYNIWFDKGFRVPCMRDFEVFSTESLSREQRYAFDRAQYLYGDSVEAKVYHLEQKGVEGLEEIREFKSKLNFGVNELVEVTDVHFNGKTWLSRLEQSKAQMTEIFESLRARFGDEDALSIESLQNIIEIDSQISRIQDDVKEGKELKPDVETIKIGVSVLNFFPNL